MRFSVSCLLSLFGLLNLSLRCGRQETIVMDSIGLETSFFCYSILVVDGGNAKINLYKKMMQKEAHDHMYDHVLWHVIIQTVLSLFSSCINKSKFNEKWHFFCSFLFVFDSFEAHILL